MEIDSSVKDPRWNSCGFDVQAAMKQAMTAMAGFIDVPSYVEDVSVVLCDDDFIHSLNKEYRGIDKPTNILSFPQIEAFEEAFGFTDLDMPFETSLGDVIISYDTVFAEAIMQGKTLEDHFKHIFLHGILHLLGLDHIEKDEAEEMEALEIRILSCMGINNPYEDAEIVI